MDVPPDTKEYRRRVLNTLELEKRMDAVEKNVVQIRTVLFGSDDTEGLRDGKRGGLVDTIRDLKILLRILIGIQILTVPITLLAKAPPAFWKLIFP